MSKNPMRAITLVFACCASGITMATELCERSAECVKGASFIAPVDVLLNKCTNLNPGKAESYRAVVSQIMRDTTPEFLSKLRASDIYAKTAAEADARIGRLSPEKLQEACDVVLKPAA